MINTSTPRVSVVIVTYERPDYLQQALTGVLQQYYQPFEVIVVDDCSKADYTAALENSPLKSLNYIKLETNAGANRARNTGIQQAQGDIIALLDDDDIWKPEFLQLHVEAYQKGADAVVCGHQRLEDENVVRFNRATKVTIETLKHGNSFSGMSAFSAKAKLLKTNLLDESLNNGQDWDIYLRLAKQGCDFVNIPAPLFYYRFGTPDGITRKASKLRVKDIEARLRAIRKHRETIGEKAFKRLMANQILSFIRQKKQKLQWIVLSIRLAGLSSTISYFVRQTRRAASQQAWQG